ncbi:MAG: peptidase M50 [Roseiflexaceae bacterium]
MKKASKITVRNLFNVPGEGTFQGQTNDNFELLKAWAGTTLAFAILRSRGNVLDRAFLTDLLISGVVCGLAFVLHELAHRIVARSYGAEAHFIANNGMLLVSIVIAFLGVFFAAPGAVWHRGILTRRQSGLIALAGPATNLVLSLVFLIGLVALSAAPIRLPGPWVIELCYVGFRLNAWIGLFNMIPAGPFDGAKVLSWNVLVFGITVGIGVLLAFILNDRMLLSLLQSFP